MHQYVANRNVFRNCLKLFPPIIGLRKLSGKEFQTDGPATQTSKPNKSVTKQALTGHQAKCLPCKSQKKLNSAKNTKHKN